MAEIIVENPPRKDPDLPVVPQAVKETGSENAASNEKAKSEPAAKEPPKAQSTSGLRFGQGRR